MRKAMLILALLATPSFAQDDAATPLIDRSIASLSGASQQLFPAVDVRSIHERYVCNASTTNNVAINLSGGTAVLNSGGSLVLAPGGCWSGRVSNLINVIGTAGQPVTAGSR